MHFPNWGHATGMFRGSRGFTPAALIAIVPAIALATGCGGGGAAKTTASTAKPKIHAVAARKTTAPAKHASTSGGGLSGAWSGQYGGAYAGTFKLHWTQSGSSLNGTIKLSAPGGTLGVHGTLAGNSIRFGTVGSVAITYSGTVSGSSMSGSYSTPNGGGSWSASKTS